jgi:hypothetical protein
MGNHFADGPWKISESGRVMEDNQDQPIGGIVVKRMTPETAALVSAAPELYSALKKVEFSFPSRSSGEPVCPICKHNDIAGHEKNCLIGKALIKAEGK